MAVCRLLCRFQNNLLILRADGIPYLCAHHHNIWNHRMFIFGIYFTDLSMFSRCQRRLIVLCSINDPRLKRGIHITIRHCNRRSPHKTYLSGTPYPVHGFLILLNLPVYGLLCLLYKKNVLQMYNTSVSQIPHPL